MSIEDKFEKPIKLNYLYVDLTSIKDPLCIFPINSNEICKITGLCENLDELYLQITYESNGFNLDAKGYAAYNLGSRLTPLNKKEIAELIKDRKRRLSFLKDSALS